MLLCIYNAFTDVVGFSAYATNSQYPIAVGDVIALPGVVTNAGGAYNPDTSTFTCPITAFYYIYFNLYVYMEYSNGHSSMRQIVFIMSVHSAHFSIRMYQIYYVN